MKDEKMIKHGSSTASRQKNIQWPSCPSCGTKNPVSKVNASLKCTKCGMILRCVRVNKRRNNHS